MMRNKLLYTFFGLSLIFVIFQSNKPLKVTRKDGTEPGYCGSPGDSFKNCTACHGGTATTINGWITSNIPTSGYIPGQRYTITAKNTSSSATRFGFEISPQNVKGDLLGKMILTDTVETKLVGNDKYITYTEFGVDGMGYKTWSFDWIAPVSGTGEVVFYGAFNSNYDGHKSFDKTTLSTLTVQENLTGIENPLFNQIQLTTFPNPANDLLNINFELNQLSNIHIQLFDQLGKAVTKSIVGNYSGAVSKQIPLNHLTNGIYYMQLTINGKTASKKITVLH